MPKTDVWMPMYWADFLADTQHLSREDLGSYILLIGAYWRRGEPLPDDDSALRRICRVDAAQWDDVRRVMAALFTIEAGVWRHKRIDAELGRARANRELASKKGKTGAQKRWGENGRGYSTGNGTGNAPAIAQAIPNDSSSPSPSPLEYISPTGAVEVELPKNFPKSEQDAIAGCMAIGVPDEFIRDTYHKALSRGGKDARECPILNWAAYVKTEWKYQQNRTEKEKYEQRYRPTNRPSPDRAAGTANEGKASQYRGVGKVAGTGDV